MRPASGTAVMAAAALAALGVLAACGLTATGTGTAGIDAGAGDTRGSGADGSTVHIGGDSGPNPSYGSRVTADLVALYEFEDKAGTVARDSALAPVNLSIGDATKVTWDAHALRLDDFTALSTTGNMTKVFEACRASKELTVEAWIEPALVVEESYARLVAMGQDNASYDFSLGSRGTSATSMEHWASMKGGENLEPDQPKVASGLLHVVMTHSSDRTLRLWVNGAEIGSKNDTEPTSSWSDRPLFVGNSPKKDRGWRGTIHLVAIYSRALDATSIAKNFAAGADP